MKRTHIRVLVAAIVVCGVVVWLLARPRTSASLDADDPEDVPQLVGIAPERLGGFVGALYTGFDVYRDTPSFSAGGAVHAGALADLATTRDAMCRLVTLFHSSAEFEPAARARKLKPWTKNTVPVGVRFVIPGHANLRALSRAQPRMLRGSLPAIAEAFAADNQAEGPADEAAQFRRIREVLIAGNLCRVAVGASTGAAAPADSGRALVYRITDYERASLLWLYDPDSAYANAERTALKTLVIYDRRARRFLVLGSDGETETTIAALD